MRFPMLAQLQTKDYLTLGNAVCGFVAIVSLFPLQFGNVFSASLFILLAIFFDFFDGKVARRAGKANDLGKQLDSLSDAVSFGAAPALLLMSFSNSVFSLVAAIIYLCAGIVRLAFFNIQKEKGVYYGLPIPVAALVSVIIFLVYPLLLSIFLVVLAFLMVSPFKIKKP